MKYNFEVYTNAGEAWPGWVSNLPPLTASPCKVAVERAIKVKETSLETTAKESVMIANTERLLKAERFALHSNSNSTFSQKKSNNLGLIMSYSLNVLVKWK